MVNKSAFEKAKLIAGLALEKKGENIVLMDMRKISAMFDWFVLVSATSSRRIKAISNYISRELSREKIRPLHSEGKKEDPNWILLDCEDVVVHIFHENLRDFYGLERLWADVPKKSVQQNEK